MKLKKQIINISNKQIAIKIMGSKFDRKKFNYENHKRKQITIKRMRIKIDIKINYKGQN
jgi:hypothetical protein